MKLAGLFILALALILSSMPLDILAQSSESTPTYIAFTSDVHGNTINLSNWLGKLKSEVNVQKLDRMVFGGDYAGYSGDSSSWTAVNDCVSKVNEIYSETPCILVRGNHDLQNGSYANGLVYNGNDYAIYALDTSLESSFKQSEIDDLSIKLNSISSSKPVFVLSHRPIHHFGGRTTTNSDNLLAVLNEHENVMFLWGHNHSQGDSQYGVIRYKGDNIVTTQGGSGKTIEFTYLSYGAMNEGASKKTYGLLATLNKAGTNTNIEFEYKDLQGNKSFNESGGSITIGNGTFDKTVYRKADSPEDGKTYLVVGELNGAYYSLTPETYESKYLKGVQVTVSGDQVTSDVSADMLWEFTEFYDGYRIVNGDDNHLYRKGSSASDSVYIGNANQYDGIDSDKNYKRYGAWIYDEGENSLRTFSTGSNNPTDYYLLAKENKGNYQFYIAESISNGFKLYLYEVVEGIPVEKYTVTFDSKGGSAVNPITNILEGSTISLPNAPTKSGHTFEGWYKEESLTNKFTSSTPIISNITVYAKWAQNQQGDPSGAAHIGLTSDVHGNLNNLTKWLNNLKSSAPTLNHMIFGGDYPESRNVTNPGPEYYIHACENIAKEAYGEIPVVLVRGNHDTKDESIFPGGLRYNGSDYAIYVLDSSGTSSSTATFLTSEINDLSQKLNTVLASKPVFVVSHCPLHYYGGGGFGGRFTAKADELLQVLNKHENVIFVWGHYHTLGDPSYGKVFTKADKHKITTTANGPEQELKFTYVNFGAMNQGNNGAHGLLATLSKDDDDTLIRFDYKGLSGNTVYSYNVVIAGSSGGEDPPIDPPIDCVYELTNSLEAGESYVIIVKSGNQYYVLTNSKPTNYENFLSGTAISLANNTISNNDIMPNMLWLAENNSSFGHMYLKNSGGYLQRQTGTDGKLSVSQTPREDKGGYDNWQYNDESLYTISTQITGTDKKFALFYDSKGYLRANNTEESVVYLYKLTVEELEDKEIVENVKLTDITVNFGTGLSEIGLPDTVFPKLDDGSNIELTVSWNDGTPEYDGNTPGTYRFEGELEEKDGILNSGQFVAEINVIVKEEVINDKEITSVNIVEDISVEYGTEIDDIDFPDKVSVNLSDGTKMDLSVSWDEGTPEYNGNSAGDYEFTGELLLPADITNPNELVAIITVVVWDEEAEDINIDTVADIDDLEVPFGTKIEDIDLPIAVEVTLDDGSTRNLGVIWDDGNPPYDPNEAGEYEFEGTINLITGVINNNNLKVKVTVIVLEEEEPPVQEYTITFNSNGGSAVSANTAPAGTTINRPGDPSRSGYNFISWNPEVPDVMPENNLTVVAQWEKKPDSTGGTSSGGGGGGGTVIRVTELSITNQPVKTEYVEGEVFDPTGMEVTVKYSDKSTKKVKGFKYSPVDKLKLSDNKITVTYGGKTAVIDIIVKASKVIEVPPVEIPADIPYPDFKDIPHDSPHYEPVKFVTTRGLYQGISKDEFGPDVLISRSMFVTILSRFEFGSDDKVPKESVDFIDLPQDWYKNAIAWAYKNKIALGVSETEFNPEGVLTWEQMVVFLYRYAKYKGYDTNFNTDVLKDFADGNKVSDYAVEAMSWALKNNLITGGADKILAPQKQASRAESADMFMRFAKLPK